jgi:hypothetical protein
MAVDAQSGWHGRTRRETAMSNRMAFNLGNKVHRDESATTRPKGELRPENI